ncbi:uncharacterized protein LOC116170607 [Photinus pyralis]|uniref:uncharacterized protein LOC116170607 n=1 Tax=Photinus pyralis TaxID=7054 RepID=UPI0012672167|nr:uncharacterized protein LOC116170607 [Photinus pyralis]
MSHNQAKALQPQGDTNKIEGNVPRWQHWKRRSEPGQSKSQQNVKQESGSRGRQSASSTSSQASRKSCHRCGRMHNPATCPTKQWQCYNCSKQGHTSTVCMARKKVNPRVNQMDEDTSSQGQGESDESLVLGHIGNLDWNKKEEAYQVELCMESQQVKMEVDSGACRSVMHKSDFFKLSSNELQPVRFKLNVITGENVNILGQPLVNVEFMGSSEQLPIIILNSASKFAPLMGRDWIAKFNPSWKNVLLKVNNVEQSMKDKDELIL